MKHTSRVIFANALLLTTVFTACKKKEDPVPVVTNPGTVEMHFDNKVGDQDIELGTKTYTNYIGDDFTVTKFNYYISNIRFNKEDGSSYAEAESYHLIEENDEASHRFSVAQIPSGKYISVTFMIGVDSTRNVSGVQSGALDPAKGMFWSWSSGYIMAKFEGTSSKSTADGNRLFYHVGGFSGENKVLKTVTLTFPAAVNINNNNSHMHIVADLAKWFGNPNVVDFSTLNTIHMPSANAKKLADNYVSMFSIEEIETK